MNRRGRCSAVTFYDFGALPLLALAIFMLVAVGTQPPPASLEDRAFAGVGGDYREVAYGVHGPLGVYPLRIRYHDNPNYHGPPVVFVHGMGTSDAYFWRMRGQVEIFPGFIYAQTRDIDAVGHAQGLVDLGFDVVSYAYPDSRQRPLEYQAYDLARVIRWTKERFISREVILIGHSIGGLICRYYVQSGQPGRANYVFRLNDHPGYSFNRYYAISDFEMKRLHYQGDVAALVLLGTPNLGSLKADGRDYGAPALAELKENSDFLRWLAEGQANARAKGYKLPPTYVFVGTAYEDYMGEGPLDFGDGIVPVASARGDFDNGPANSARVFTFPLDHFQLAMDGEVLARIFNLLRGFQ